MQYNDLLSIAGRIFGQTDKPTDLSSLLRQHSKNSTETEKTVCRAHLCQVLADYIDTGGKNLTQLAQK